MAKKNTFSGPSQRQLRVGELIRRSLAGILARGDHYEPGLDGVVISVGEVKTSPDFRVATVLIYPTGKDGDEVIATLEKISGRLRLGVTKEIKMKYSPELRFRLDRSIDMAEETQRLIDKLPAYGPENEDD